MWECLHDDLIDANTNCDIFTTSGSSYICDGCPSTSYTLVSMSLDANLNPIAKGCAQILVPNAILYKATTIYDMNGYIYLTSSRCSSSITTPPGSNTLYIPSYAASIKDSTGVACLQKDATIKTWYIASSQYKIATCQYGQVMRYENGA